MLSTLALQYDFVPKERCETKIEINIKTILSSYIKRT